MIDINKFLNLTSSKSVKFIRKEIKTLQVNVGKLCNQACHHCHVDAGPKRKEIMQRNVFEKIISLLKKKNSVDTIDITGGAPELNPHFRFFVKELRLLGKNIIDRCNLTVLFEQGQEDTAEFLANNRIKIRKTKAEPHIIHQSLKSLLHRLVLLFFYFVVYIYDIFDIKR